LVRGSIKKSAALIRKYGKDTLTIDSYNIIQKAKTVKTVKSDTVWEDLSRYSGSQKQRILFGGVKGRVIYQGDLEEFIPLIKFCKKTHVGKRTSFGLGKIKFSIVE